MFVHEKAEKMMTSISTTGVSCIQSDLVEMLMTKLVEIPDAVR